MQCIRDKRTATVGTLKNILGWWLNRISAVYWSTTEWRYRRCASVTVRVICTLFMLSSISSNNSTQYIGPTVTAVAASPGYRQYQSLSYELITVSCCVPIKMILVIPSRQWRSGVLWGACVHVCRSGFVGLSVSLQAYLRNYTSNFTKFSQHVACGCGSVLFWRRCNTNTLCTSGFVIDDVDVMLSHNGANGGLAEMSTG